MSLEKSVSILAPERTPADGNVEADRRGYDVATLFAPEVLEVLAGSVKQLMFATKVDDPRIHGHLVTVYPNDPKLVVLSPTANNPTGPQLIGKSQGYQSKHGINPKELVLGEEAQRRFDAIVDELTDLCIAHLRANPPEKREGAAHIKRSIPLARLKNKFSTFSLSAGGSGSRGQMVFERRRQQYLKRLREAVKQKSAERGTPLECNFSSFDNSAEVFPVVESPPKGFFDKLFHRIIGMEDPC